MFVASLAFLAAGLTALGADSISWEGSISYPRFDPAYGHLTEVQFDWLATDGHLLLDLHNPQGDTEYSLLVEMQIYVGVPGASIAETWRMYGSKEGFLPAGFNGYDPVAFDPASHSVATSLPSDLEFFTGAEPVDVIFMPEMESLYMTPSYLISYGGGYGAALHGLVTYYYEVPEPGVISLLVTGLGAMWLRARRAVTASCGVNR